jgi:nucleoside-diphosphate-sugar epimerase
MKVLVTGSNGFLGGALVARLLAHGITDIRCFVRPGSNRSRLEKIQAESPGVCLEIFEGSLASAASALKALEGVDLILHLAAGATGAAADIFLNSVVSSKNLLEAITASGKDMKVVLISSFGVYGVAGLPKGAVIDEHTPLEPHPDRRDNYSFAKLRQEQLFWDAREAHKLRLTVLRPGVIYGPGGTAISSRVGLNLFGVFLHLGGRNLIPLSYVDNCAEAIVAAGLDDSTDGEIYNVHDSDLITCAAYLKRYKRDVKQMRSIKIPYFVLKAMSGLIESYNRRSRGQLPAVFTPYKTATTWKGHRFDNSKLRSIGWEQIVSTDEGLRRTFESLRDVDAKAAKQGAIGVAAAAQ